MKAHLSREKKENLPEDQVIEIGMLQVIERALFHQKLL